MNFDNIRGDFPILNQKVHGKRLAYLDNAATSQKPNSVIEAESEYYQKYNSNIHRSIHHLSEIATEKYEHTRKLVAEFINAYHPSEVIFTKNATEGINLLATILKSKLHKGDEILLTQMEHHSNIVPWQMIAQEKGLAIKYLPVTKDGTLDLSRDTLASLVSGKTKIFSLTHISNVLGTINNVKEVIKAVKELNGNIIIVVDGAQYAPHFKVDVKSTGADFYIFTAHKMLGPTGVGILWGKRNLLSELPPYLGGGEMIQEVYWDRFVPHQLPHKYEAGTPNIAGVITFAESIKYLIEIGFEKIRNHEVRLLTKAYTELSKIEGLTIYGPQETNLRSGVISFNLGEIHAHDVASVLDTEGVAIRSGHHCAEPLVNRVLNCTAVARASFYFYNTEEDIDQLVKGVNKAKEIFSLR